jgi:ADP-ribose pyrophosphatase YjhB (NUDIX family)
MNFCSECGAPVILDVPSGDNLPRHVCTACQTVHYQNPKMVVGCIPVWNDQILLCRRAIEPRYGLWTLPAGFMENGETAVQGAVRETREEAGTDVEIGSLFSLCSLPHIDQVYLMFHGRLRRPEHAPGTESLETALFREADIPWNDLAFPVVRETLRDFFADRRNGTYRLHLKDI